MTTETTDTREEQAERLIAEMKAARGYIYPSHEFAARQDPEFLEAYNRLVGLALLHEGVDLENRALAPKYRELVVIGILAARGGTALSHMRRAIRLGATEQEIMEVGQAAIVPAGAPAFLSVMSGLAQLHEELESGEESVDR